MQTDTSSPTVLILGARGRFGLAAARAFADAGWRVLGQMRPGAQPPVDAPVRVEWLSLDLADTQALTHAAQGAVVVVHALNPAYTNQAWSEQVLPLTEAALALCRALDATLMVPGNIYNFGKGMPAQLRDDAPQRAHTVKGRIRVAMEEVIQASGVRAIVIRAGDFFGSGKGSWFDQAMVGKLQKGVFTYPGARDVPTAWAYLPDLARTFVAVAQKRGELAPFDVFHFGGYRLTGQDWIDALQPIAQRAAWVRPGAALTMGRMPWAVIRLGALFMPQWASLVEMRYLWDTPHALANQKLETLIGQEPHTALGPAAQTALADLGMLPTTPGTQHAIVSAA
ncbi:MAG: sugar nucleotide-binding protein [Rhodoferax sp.]|nr:sugar nucleotide-binding protein [Rhodoferax sp.]